MEQLIGENISVLPFKEIKKVADLIYFDGPILSHFKDKHSKDILFYWVDHNDNYNRWIAFQIDEKQLYSYLLQHKSLKDNIDYVGKKLIIEKSITDNSRITKEIKDLKELFKPTIVKSAISSFAIGVSPNTIIDAPDFLFTKEWLEGLFSEFKNDVV